jgi:beta-glucosidase
MGLDPSIEGEEGSCLNSGDKEDLELPSVQREMVDAILALGKPTVFVNVSGSCINLEREDQACNAVLQCFYPGAEGGNALANILFGKVSPSGRLPVSFYRSVEELPPFEDYSMENRTYKFFKGKCVYDFGHGLTYANIEEQWIDDYTVELANDSDVETDYSVLRFSYEPHKELKDFRCVHLAPHTHLRVCFDQTEE